MRSTPSSNSLSPAPELSVIIPLYNEQENVAPLFERLFPELSARRLSFEVLVIDDGSTDQSFVALQREAERRPQLKVIRAVVSE